MLEAQSEDKFCPRDQLFLEDLTSLNSTGNWSWSRHRDWPTGHGQSV